MKIATHTLQGSSRETFIIPSSYGKRQGRISIRVSTTIGRNLSCCLGVIVNTLLVFSFFLLFLLDKENI